MGQSRLAIAQLCADIALEAAVPILKIYESGIVAKAKADGSPVTEADIAADTIIRSKLQAYWPDIPVISEESEHSAARDFDRFFLVDPLDGTREFINRNGEFTVNIALIEKGHPVLGVIYAPTIKDLFIGADRAFRCEAIGAGEKCDPHCLREIKIRSADPFDLTALESLSHCDPETKSYLDLIKPKNIRRSGSSLKFCKIANGEADFYPRFGPTNGWDIAAGDAILRAAGGGVFNADSEGFRYTSKDLRNGPFLAVGDPVLVKTLTPEFTRACRNRPRAKNGIAE